MALAECLDPSFPLVARSLLARLDSQALFAAAEQSGLVSLKELGERAIRAGETTREEFLRVFGGRLVLSDSRT